MEEMDYDDWTEKLIKTVQSKPALYNKAMKKHSDRNLIARLWTEVCQTMIENWYNLSPGEKTLKGKEIQQRWRNLRTCFKREINKQRKGKSDPAAKKRRKYIYFDQLLFLLPTLTDRDTISKTSPPPLNREDSEVEEQQIIKEPILSEQQHSTKYKKNKTLSYKESLLNILKDKKAEEIDEDKSFLLSLVPSFKRLTDDQKIEAKLGFLKVIQRISHPKHYTSSQSPTNFHLQGHHLNHSLLPNNNYCFPQLSSQHSHLSADICLTESSGASKPDKSQNTIYLSSESESSNSNFIDDSDSEAK